MLRYTAYINPTGTPDLHLDRAAYFRSEVIETFGPGPLLITVERLPAGPTNKMHRYYRGVVLSGVIDALNDVGNFVLNSQKNRTIVHNQLKPLLLPDAPQVIDPMTGEISSDEWSLANVPRPIYGKYLADIRDLVLTMTGWEIPAPPTDWLTAEQEIAAQPE